MNFRTLLTSIILGACAFSGVAATKSQNAHRAAHQAQLANHKSKLDKSVISNMIKEEVIAKEAVATVSSEANTLIADLLKEAKTHIGKPYRSGSKGPSAFDCSGFSSYVFKQFGYKLSPCSRTQYTEGKAVDRKDLRKGDLVFFTSRSSGKNVGHVGIVYSVDEKTGGFQFIHASIKGIKISNFEGYYVPRYIGAKRIIE